MERHWLCLFVFTLLMTGPVLAQHQHPVHVAVVDSGLVHGDARLTLLGGSERLEMALLGQSRQYSREQARLRLAQFFRAYPPGAFSWSIQEVGEDAWYATGQYQVASTGEMLRVYVHWKRSGEIWKLATIHVFADYDR